MASDTAVLIGIDVGMTCTGVAWAMKNRDMRMSDPHVIQRWPGNGGAQCDKVPTIVSYAHGVLVAWGFLAAQATEDPQDPVEAHDWYKIYFDPEEYTRARQLGTPNLPPSHEDVRTWYRDFLRRLHMEIEKQLEGRIGTAWSRANVEFMFSVPTTWSKVNVIHDFELLVREAGFGGGGPNHRASVTLTEAEAAAVHTFKAGAINYSNVDVILVVDAGGGTTDLALLKSHVQSDGAPKLEQLDVVRGYEIGSVVIDLNFEDLAEKRLKPIQHRLRRPVDDVAWDMMRSSFIPFKVEFGTEYSDHQNIKMMKIPGLGEDFDAPEAGIKGGKMRFTNPEIQSLFDTQMAKICKLVDHQMNRMGQVTNGGQITHMVLSGELGSSEYVKRKLKERYVNTMSPHPFAKSLLIVTSDASSQRFGAGPDSEVAESSRKSSTGVIGVHRCRMSLGIVCSQPYDPIKHRGQVVTKDPFDGKAYVARRIDWFIRQGQPISEQAISHQFYRILPKDGGVRGPWLTEIASTQDPSYLPISMFEHGAKTLCTLRSDLSGVPLSEFEKHKRAWYKFWKSTGTHYRANYDIQFRMKPAGVEFELWYKGQQFAQNMHVTWDEGANEAAPRDHR